MIIPELPSYLTSLGGEDYKGLIIGLFTVAAFISRPFSGKLADTVGRIPVMIVGTLVCVLMGILYPFLGGVLAFLILRFFHGFSTGFQPTGVTAYVADIVPFNKRGEALGYVGVAGSLGMASGPAIGSVVAQSYSIDIMFYLSAVTGLLSLLSILGLKETHQSRVSFKWSQLAVWKESLYDPLVKPAVFIMVSTSYCFGQMLTIIPDFSDHLSIKNRGLFFAVIPAVRIIIATINTGTLPNLSEALPPKILETMLPAVKTAKNNPLFLIER